MAQAAAAQPASVAPSILRIKRVVSCFLVSSASSPPDRTSLRVAVFHRQSTMPTFPSHWAPCSGSLEVGEMPRAAACRELAEETNVPDPEAFVALHHGLPVDVPIRPGSIIRVYPFAVEWPTNNFQLELRGTEHDKFKTVSVEALERLQPSVPALATAFHRATFGRYYGNDDDGLDGRALPLELIRTWASDRVSGATTMAQNALELIQQCCYNNDVETTTTGEHDTDRTAASRTAAAHMANRMMAMRPTMVAIVNALRPIQERRATPTEVLQEISNEAERVVKLAVDAVEQDLRRTTASSEAPPPRPKSRPPRVVVFSRSSTLVKVLEGLRNRIGPMEVFCSRSTPGNEGELMARDVDGMCLDDATLLDRVQCSDGSDIDLVLVGCDCVTKLDIYNKVGTAALAKAAANADVPVVCCADHFKVWDDAFPPPLEDVFEGVPRDLFQVVVQ